ncbi:MAG: DegT/DnrJ/EryC1/StrS family aminotransferase [Aliidongia sp.]
MRSRNRDALQAGLKARGIGSNIHYPVPVHLQPAYAGRLQTARTAWP